MQIIVTPEDIIKRLLFPNYKRFVLKNKTDEEIKKWIEENKPEVLSENDAYVIGLLKVIETNNLVHRFRLYIEDLLKNRSTIVNDQVVINKSVLIKEIVSFNDAIPDGFNPDYDFQVAMNELKDYIYKFYNEIKELKNVNHTMKDGKKYTFILSSDVNKVIKSLPSTIK